MKKLLVERKGPSENIAFISVLISILCVFSLLMSFFPLSAIFIIIFIPAITAVGTQYIEKQYLWIFAISALAATLLVTIYNYVDTLFYIYPGIISGFFYGILRKERMPISLVIFLSSLIGMALNYLALPLIKALYQIEMISFTIKLFNLENIPNINYIIPSFIFSLSLGEITLSHLLIEILNEKLTNKIIVTNNIERFYPLVSLLFSFLTIFLAFFLPSLGYFFMIISFYFSLSSTIYLLSFSKKIHLVLLIILLTIDVFLFAFLYKLMPCQTGILLFSIFLISNDLVFLPIGLQLRSRNKNYE